MKVGFWCATWNFGEWTARQIADCLDAAQCWYGPNWNSQNDYDAKINEARNLADAQGTPRIKPLLYWNFPCVSTNTAGPPPYATAVEYARAQGWLLKDQNGHEVIGDYSSLYGVDCSIKAYRDYQNIMIASWLSRKPTLWDGVMADNMMKPDIQVWNYLWSSATAFPVLHADGETPWTDQGLRDAYSTYLNEMIALFGKIVMPNGIGNGSAYWNPAHKPGYDWMLANCPGLKGGMSEHWLFTDNNHVFAWLSEADWQSSVNLAVEMQTRFLSKGTDCYWEWGCGINDENGPLTLPSGVTDTQVVLYGYCSILLAANYTQQNLLSLGFTANHHLYSTNVLNLMAHLRKNVDVGNPTGPYARAGNVFGRDFTKGYVIVNPSNTSYAVTLDQEYTDMYGNPVVFPIACAPHTGIILLKEEEPPPPPPTVYNIKMEGTITVGGP